MARGRGGFIGQDGLNAPDSPTGVSGTAGDASVSVAFTAPTDVGASAITGYVATSNDGIGTAGSSSPITVTGLSNGTTYTFNVWAINAFGYSAPSDASTGVAPVAAVYAMVAGFGGGGGSYSVNIDRFNISVQANAADFGDLTHARNSGNVMSSSTRAVFSCGRDAGTANLNILDYVNPTSAGNATDFGDATFAKQFGAQFGSDTRGCVGGAGDTYSNVIDYITIASVGNATDFGDLTQTVNQTSGFSSTTRGVRACGALTGSGTEQNVMDYVTIASTGNATDFGDSTLTRRGQGGCSSPTRGLTAGGFTGSTNSNSIDYVTIANTGNATDFGDLITHAGLNVRAASSHTVGAFIDSTNAIVSVTIASTGNATDFADLTGTTSDALMTNSNGHGGIA
jgi:hypothetical protein